MEVQNITCIVATTKNRKTTFSIRMAIILRKSEKFAFTTKSNLFILYFNLFCQLYGSKHFLWSVQAEHY